MTAIRFAALTGLCAILALTGCKKAPSVAPDTEAAGGEAENAVPALNEPSDEPATADPGGDIELAEGEGHGGSAHIHGLAALVAAVDGAGLSVTVDSPLANFGLPENSGTGSLKAAELASQLIQLEGGACTSSGATLETVAYGDHNSVLLSVSYTCTALDSVSGVTFKGFEAYPDIERVDALYAGAESQSGGELTPDEPTLIFD